MYDLDCYNCGSVHAGGAKNCKHCLVCGKNNHPTRDCAMRKKPRAGEQVKFLQDANSDTEDDQNEYEETNFLGVRGE